MFLKNTLQPPHKAMVLSAGMGRRLRPLTLETPKPLVPICLVPILSLHLAELSSIGIKSVVINTHYMASKIRGFVEAASLPIDILISHEPEILGTGGGISAARDFWTGQDAAIIINSDILTDYDLIAPYYEHLKQDNHVTMLLHHHPDIKGVEIDNDMNIKGFEDGRMAFTGIHYIAPEIIKMMPLGPFHIIDFYNSLIRDGFKIKGIMAKGNVWYDIGLLEIYLKVQIHLLKKDIAIPQLGQIHNPIIADVAIIHKGVELKNCIIGNRAVIGKNAFLTDCIVWDGGMVEPDEILKSCIITPLNRIFIPYGDNG